MTMNPFEIRLETLRMAKEMLDQNYNVQQDLMCRMIDQTAEINGNIEEAYEKYVPQMYKPEEIVKKANELYAYVCEKK
jgi:predicted small secreted protein